MVSSQEKKQQMRTPLNKAVVGWAIFLIASLGMMLFPLAFIFLLPMVLMGYWAMINRGYIALSALCSAYLIIVAIMLGGLLRISLSTLIALASVGLIVYRTCFSYLKNSYWVAMLNAVAFGLFGIGGALVLSSVVPAVSLSDLVYDNIVNSKSVVVQIFSEQSYESAELEANEKLEKTDPNYALAARKYYAANASDNVEMLPYHALGTVIFAVGAGGILGLYFFTNRKTHLRNLRLNRKYLLIVAVPAFAIGVLSFIDGFAPFTTTVVNSAVTVPTGLMFYTLSYDFALRFKRRGRIIATCVLLPICIISSFVSLVFFIISLIGLGDAFLNLRKYFDVLFRE